MPDLLNARVFKSQHRDNENDVNIVRDFLRERLRDAYPDTAGLVTLTFRNPPYDFSGNTDMFMRILSSVLSDNAWTDVSINKVLDGNGLLSRYAIRMRTPEDE